MLILRSSLFPVSGPESIFELFIGLKQTFLLCFSFCTRAKNKLKYKAEIQIHNTKNVQVEQSPHLLYDLWTFNFAFIPSPALRLLSAGNVSVTISYSLESTTSHHLNGPVGPL